MSQTACSIDARHATAATRQRTRTLLQTCSKAYRLRVINRLQLGIVSGIVPSGGLDEGND